MPISRVETCRIGGNPGFEAFCGGPCPNYHFRADMTPENPSTTWERGSLQTIHYSKNNHVGGFVRLSLVPIGDMERKDVHDLMAFYFGCWSSGGYTCDEKEHHRDCGFDRDNLAWKADVLIPTVYPDGVYVLGWSWYGGGETYGSFGEYWDCAYVRIQGGPLEDVNGAVFRPGPKYSDGCQSSVERHGICVTEPCGKELWSRKMVPGEFGNGNPSIYRAWFEQALERPENRIAVAEHDDFGVYRFKVYDSGNEMELGADINEFIELGNIQGISIVPEVFGPVDRVDWIVNGEFGSSTTEYPFSVSGSQPDQRSPIGHNLYAWDYHYLDKRMFVTAVCHSGGRRVYFSHDFYFRR